MVTQTKSKFKIPGVPVGYKDGLHVSQGLVRRVFTVDKETSHGCVLIRKREQRWAFLLIEKPYNVASRYFLRRRLRMGGGGRASSAYTRARVERQGRNDSGSNGSSR